MPIFISYSQQDAGFVDILATNLVKAKHHVWMDRWELNIGDSLTSKIEEALTDSSAILVILSKHSVESPWCKRELTAGLVRELEERKIIVMPCVIDNCKIPLFLRDKLYADFRKNPDKAFALVENSLGRISNPAQGRAESPEFYTDWALEWNDPEIFGWSFRWTFVDHGPNLPYVVVGECSANGDNIANRIFKVALDDGKHIEYIRNILQTIVVGFEGKPLGGLIEDTSVKFVIFKATGKSGETWTLMYTYRRMGIDNGMDTYVHLDNNLKFALKHMDDVDYQPE